MKALFIVMFFTGMMSLPCFAQPVSDSAQLGEVVVKGYFSEQPLLRVPSSISVINQQVFQYQSVSSLLPAINTVPGVRMEERSPGSYRLSVRGSLLRSPFGIRNIKVYLDDFLLTDAGGNTYLNLLDPASVGRIEILKGPEGSIYGANTGGVVLINSKPDSNALQGSLSGGSYGLLQQNLKVGSQFKNFNIGVNQSFQRADGYRENSRMNRKSILISPRLKYSPKAELKGLFLFSDLEYGTPGGLTLAQSEQNPRSARPGTPVSPGAAEQKASIFNKTALAGVTYTRVFGPRLKHVISATGSVTDFSNPFITTFETRDEKGVGLRTYFELKSDTSDVKSWNLQLGAETQRTSSEKQNYDNLAGQAGERQNFANFKASQSFIFSRISWMPLKRLSTEAALSVNFYNYSFQNIYPLAGPIEARRFKTRLMPRIAVSYLLKDNLALRASLSRGFSPPTIEEIRPSDQIINTSLQAETGWNYETGIRLSMLNNRIYLDGVLFNFELEEAIVRRVDAADSENFVNAGGTQQTGLEAQLNAWLIPPSSVGVVRGLKVNQSYTYSHFTFSNYTVDAADYSGNKLTGVPEHSTVTSSLVYLPLQFNLFVQHSYFSAIPLNDANTSSADAYQLWQAKAMYRTRLNKIDITAFAGTENLFNARYSLGNDLNAFGGRFYNPAPPRTFYFGLTINVLR